MASDYEIELTELSPFRCEDCGGLNVRLTRFVARDGATVAVYYAQYGNGHDDAHVDVLISLGEWGEGTEPAQRVAFYLRVRLVDGNYASGFYDATESPWADAEVMGEKLSRDQALAHPWKNTAFEILDAACARDLSIRRYFERVECGDAAIPLEWGYGLPDELFPLRDDPAGRVRHEGKFASLDDRRFFVRCLLPVPVEGYETWRVGLWVEVSRADYDRGRAVWGHHGRYRALRFDGHLANDVATDIGLPVPARAPVSLHVPDAKALPEVDPRCTPALADLFRKPWAQADFEAYAVARGFL